MKIAVIICIVIQSLCVLWLWRLNDWPWSKGIMAASIFLVAQLLSWSMVLR